MSKPDPLSQSGGNEGTQGQIMGRAMAYCKISASMRSLQGLLAKGNCYPLLRGEGAASARLKDSEGPKG